MNRKTHTAIVLLVVFGSFLFYAHSTGITDVTRKSSAPGCTCHAASPSDQVTVTINGPDEVPVNGTATYTVTISGGPLSRAGTNIAASAGTLTPAGGSGLKIQGGELTHSLPKEPGGGVVSFEFTYLAPAEEGEQTIYANGNSVNFNGQNNGDQWNFAPNKVITITSTTGVEDENILNTYNLDQNFPNPFNPSTSLQYTIGSRQFVTLKVYDILGNEIAELVSEEKSPGEYSVQFDASGLTSGIYYYKLTAGEFSETRKMILMK